MGDIVANIERGMQFLDARISNWTDAIDIDNLRLSSCTNCILGQLFKDFSVGVEHLHIPFNPGSLGFNIVSGTTYADLTKTWKEAIKKRKEEQNG
jgi:hypothetical protein